MDKNILLEYADMKEEIKDLRQRIEKDKKELAKLDRTVVTDSVSCGKKGKKPIRTVKIQGRPVATIKRKRELCKRRMDRYERLEAELLELQDKVEEYIESIEKSEIRIMFRMYYIDNLTWVRVAMRMNQLFPKRRIKYTEDSCRMRHNRFLEKVA